MDKTTLIRFAQEEDYKKRNVYNVSSLHRASTSPETIQSPGEEEKKNKDENQEQLKD